MNGRSLDLTFKEFELLKFLAQHPGRVFTRAQLLQEVWGYDYFGGTRTVDVHVRRLRAKLGAENEALIGTVRNVGYRFVPVKSGGVAAGGLTGEPGSEVAAADEPDDSAREDLAEERHGGGHGDLADDLQGSDGQMASLSDGRSVPASWASSVTHGDS
jgi:DNA-binding winged helix-turn-helix (wHTH) protein